MKLFLIVSGEEKQWSWIGEALFEGAAAEETWEYLRPHGSNAEDSESSHGCRRGFVQDSS